MNSSASCWPSLWTLQPPQLTCSLVALRVLGSIDSSLLCYMEGRLLQASLQSVMMLPVSICSQEEQLHLLQQHTSNKDQTIKQRHVQGVCWTLQFAPYVFYILSLCQTLNSYMPVIYYFSCSVLKKLFGLSVSWLLWRKNISSLSLSSDSPSKQYFSLADKKSSNHAKNLSDRNKTDDDWEVSEATGLSV